MLPLSSRVRAIRIHRHGKYSGDCMKRTHLSLLAPALAFTGGIAGVAVGYAYSSAFNSDPVWLGPAILVGGVGALVVSALLAPSAIRAIRSERRP